mmetsp:Transcript_4526/g.7709  ORF Transcript_4526/g.7709 Transcript_4526/m.7709 type:complete len:268 (+) Transcript_4526:389-1192(+)
MMAVLNEQGISLIDIDLKQVSGEIKRTGILAFAWSPSGNFIVSCEKFTQGQNNLNIWDARTGQLKSGFPWKDNTRDGPNSINFTNDERYMARVNGKKVIEVYEKADLTQPLYRIGHSAAVASSISEQPKAPVQKTEAQAPKGKEVGKELEESVSFDGIKFIQPLNSEQVFLVAWQNGEVLSESEDIGTVFVFDFKKSFERPKFRVVCPKAQSISIIPAPKTAHAMLIWSQNLNDSTGKSYYGEHSLQYVRLIGGMKQHFIAAFDNQI